MNLDNLKLFVTIVEKGGLSAAGRELGLSPASVSERLASIEAYYGAGLLTRSTRSIRLTDEGRLLLDGAKRLLAEAETLKGMIRLGTQKLSGSIKLSAPVDLGQARIVQILDRFLTEHSELNIELCLTDSFVDLIGEGFDFAIRYGSLADSNLKVRRIGQNRHVVCASPAYLKQNGAPAHPDDLAQHDCILMRFGARIKRSWSFRIDGKLRNVAVRGRRIANSGDLVRRWCLEGKGIAQKSVWDVQDDLNAGRLIELLPDYAATGNSLQIVYPSTYAQPRRVRLLIDTLTQALASQHDASVF